MPRHRFTKGGLFGWVEVEGTTVSAVQGRREDEATLQPTVERFGSEQLAQEQARALVAKFHARGYEPDAFGDSAAAKRALHAKTELANVAELEDIVADDPANDGAWSVLEDKLLEVEDPRGQLLMVARAKGAHEERLRAEFLPQLFGNRHALYRKAISHEEWRGGYLLDVVFEPDPPHMLDTFLTLPATRLLRSLQLTANTPPPILDCALRLVRAKSRPRTLCELRLVGRWYSHYETVPYDVAQLGALSLQVLGSTSSQLPLRNVVVLPELRELEAAEESWAGLRALLTGTMPALHTLRLNLNNLEPLESPSFSYHRTLRETIQGLAAFAPALRRLELDLRYASSRDVIAEVIATMATQVELISPARLSDL